MKKRRLLTMGMALALAMTVTISPMYAQASQITKADGVAAETPGGSGGDKDSTGAAIITKQLGETEFKTENDDDNQAKDVDTSGADINVWAKVIDSSSKIYKVDLAWGAMKFEYKNGNGVWDVETHEYTGTGQAAWTLAGYVDGTNNKITVTNHSNNGIDAGFAYTMETNAFNNAGGTIATAGTDIVVGNFFADNIKAQAGAGILQNVATGVTNKLTDSKIALDTADNGTGAAGTPTTKDVFFAFSGTPDDGKGAVLSNFTKVGVITVTIEPQPIAP